MEIVRCEKGHFYDAEQCSSCPTCAKERAGKVNDYGATEPIGATMPADSGFSAGDVIEPMSYTPNGGVGDTIPATDPLFTQPEAGFGSSAGRVQDYTPTTPVYQGGQVGFNPVVGWLVCVDGPDKGSDFRIHSQYNYIGRAMSMDICIRGDSHISNERAAIIAYDDQERIFSFGPGSGHNLVRVNGKMIINAVTLNPYDELTVGVTKLLFVPLCGERFDWNEK